MTGYLLDTNIASHIIKGDVPDIRRHLENVPIQAISISTITQAELLFGVAKRGHPHGLKTRVHEFLLRVNVLPWDSEAAETYGELRTTCESEGVSLAPMDMMIAAHAKALQRSASKAGTISVLVTRDRVFSRIPSEVGLLTADW